MVDANECPYAFRRSGDRRRRDDDASCVSPIPTSNDGTEYEMSGMASTGDVSQLHLNPLATFDASSIDAIR